MRASNIFGLILSILETYIFVGIFYGWHELNRLFKNENVFGFKCLTDQTLPVPSSPSEDNFEGISVLLSPKSSEYNTLPVHVEDISGSGVYPLPGTNITCAGQDQEFARIFQLGYSLGMIISFPLGICIDKIGSVQTRFISCCFYTLSWIILSCYKLNDYCIYAWILLAISGFTFLITNYKVMNYYAPAIVGTAITLLCGVFDASASVGKILGIIYDSGTSLTSIFIAMAILSLLLVANTALVHAYTTPPSPLPENFSIFDYSFVGYILGRTPVSINQSINESGPIEEESSQDQNDATPLIKDDTKEISLKDSIINVDFVFGVFWYLILCVRMSSWFGWMHVWSQTLHFHGDQQRQFDYVKGFFFYFSIPIAALPGLIVDLCKKYFNSRLCGVTITLLVASLSAFAFSAMQAASVGQLQLAEASVFFGVMARTFTYGSYALFVNFAFEQKYFGTLMGFTSVFCGLISLSNDSIFAFIIDKDGLDRNFVPVDIAFAIACCVSLLHPIQMSIRHFKK